MTDESSTPTEAAAVSASDEASIAELLAHQPTIPMPDAVWQRIETALSIEQGNRDTSVRSRGKRAPLRPFLDKSTVEERQHTEH